MLFLFLFLVFVDLRMHISKSEKQEKEKHGPTEDQSFDDVMKHIVAHFMSKNVQGLGNRHFCYRGIPNYYSFRSSETRNIGIQGIQFLARIHIKHSFSGNREASMVH